MSINKPITAFVVVLVLSGNDALCASLEPAKVVPLTQQETVRMETSVARAVVWYRYWYERVSEAQLRKQAAHSKPISYTLCLGENGEPCYYLEAYQWKVVLTEIGGERYGFDVEDYRALARGDAKEAKRSYLEALKNESAVIGKGLLQLRPDHLSVLAFEKPGQKSYSLITNTLTTNLLSTDTSRMLREEMAEDKVSNPLAVHVGGFSAQSPWVYYYVEGMPYVGKMLVDPSSGGFIHDEFLYIHENPREAALKNIRRAIDKSGTKLRVSVGK
jgi:hypothetical protein